MASAAAGAAAAAKDAVAERGIYRHPMVRNAWVDANIHVLPKDTRLLRDVPLKELPNWLAGRTWSPVGALYAFKRAKFRMMTNHTYPGARSPSSRMYLTWVIPAWMASYFLCHYPHYTDADRFAK